MRKATPNQYADFKSLVGEVADKTKGADRIGKKTAVKLRYNEFTTIEILHGIGLKQIEKEQIGV